jgi:hypothetical protein
MGNNKDVSYLYVLLMMLACIPLFFGTILVFQAFTMMLNGSNNTGSWWGIAIELQLIGLVLVFLTYKTADSARQKRGQANSAGRLTLLGF